MPTLTHNANITVTVTLSTLAPTSAGFSTALLLVPLATNSLNGVRVVEYTSLALAQAAATATYISAATLAILTDGFGQSPPPASIKVGYVDLVGSETYATGLTACIAYDAAFYGVCIFVRTTTEQAAVGALIETHAKKMLFMAQSGDSSWLDSGIPAALSAMALYERTAFVYHDVATEGADLAYLCNRLQYNPDTQSVAWNAFSVGTVGAYSVQLTEAQRLFALNNNINVLAQYGGATLSPDKGVVLTSAVTGGRPIEEIITADWFATRLLERFTRLHTTIGDRGGKLGVNITGQNLVLALSKGLLSEGVVAGHFNEVDPISGEPGTSAVSVAIVEADITARQLRQTVRAQNVRSLRLMTFNIYFSLTALAA